MCAVTSRLDLHDALAVDETGHVETGDDFDALAVDESALAADLRGGVEASGDLDAVDTVTSM